MPDPKTPPAKPQRSQLISLPIFWQVLGLSLLVLVLALGINTWFVLNAPEPAPSGYRMAEAVAALKTGQAKLSDGRWLKAVTTTTAPDFVARNPEHKAQRWMFQSMISNRLAGDLGVPANTVWIDIKPPQHYNPFHHRHRYDDNAGPQPDDHGALASSDAPPVPGQGFAPGAGPNSAPNPGPNSGQDAGTAGPRDHDPNDRAPGDGNADTPRHNGDFGSGFGAGGFDHGPPPEGFGGRSLDQMHDQMLLRYFSGPDRGRTEILYPAFTAAWKLSDGSYRVISPPRDLINPWQMRLLMGFGVTALIILPLAWLLSRRLSRPIVAFSEAAAKVGFEDDSPPVLAVGPREVRAAADVLNAMQDRIKKQVESRTALMGAIAHDLKTPLARLRLRIEDLPAAQRDKIAGDIAHMDGLIRSAMSFTSAHKLAETLKPIDLSALVESLCEDLTGICQMEPPLIENNVMIKGDTVALKRILTNLAENAERYAGSCRIELSTRGKEVELAVIDHGPGLPAEALEAVFEPFYRLESSRNRDTGGSGLGLSVARSLTEAQGGTLKLINRYEGAKVVGLEARLTLERLVRG